MGSLLSSSLGFDAITRDDLLELGFSPYNGLISHMFGEPYEFKIDLAVFEHPGGPIVGNKIVDRFQLIVTLSRELNPDSDPVAVLTRKLFIRRIASNNELEWELDNKNAIVKTVCDLPTLKAMMDENYLRSLIHKNIMYDEN